MDAKPSSRPRRGNAFDALRLVAAAAVLVSHSWVLSGGHREPHIGLISLGQLSVLLFFGISGFLITQSWLREPRLGRFVVKRALRIYPALIAVVVFAAFVLGPLATNLSLRDYFLSGETYRYVAENILMTLAYTLPGVFEENPFNAAVNGSLWTLPHEMKAYTLIALLGVCGVLRRRESGTIALVVVTFALLVVPVADPFLLRAFCVGAALQLWRDVIPWRWSIAFVLLALWLVLRDSEATFWIAAVAVPYASILVAYRAPSILARLTRRGDISYGVYVWAFPVQQSIIALWLDVGAVMLTVVALPITVVFAVISWKLVERPALQLKNRKARRIAPDATQPVPAAA
jgi:peptidoglycan/LPS O-acetylase OafA/YrhL